MIRFILVSLSVILFLVLSIPILIIEWFIGKTNPEKRDWQSLNIVKGMFRYLLALTGVTVTVKGAENIPTKTAVLFVGNHRSYFDILVGYVTVPSLTGFVAKKEMLRYPLLKDWMRNVNCLFLDRVNMKEGLKTILTGIEKVKHGISIWIFPEGTRNRNKDVLEMLPFKEGSLKIAEKAGCPVVPVAITGTAEIFESHIPFMKPSHVIIEFGTPFYVKELEPEKKKFAGAYTRDIIKGMLEDQLEERESWKA
ncbi:lysophospholipid acyltransferase family protein [Clostridium sp. AM58-1XD]|uniref:lysophospholipid acyltransferase family protein n=1 Tax=Clostridium sp. AM58-1XD TaxID=2292307 RepID=UPI000E5468B3|nr:lysophospholipid acyltransferase family protein [Clostridium sp. AM58-1XD]RGZ00206.1 1-acyl-sn-glycerol-3-phosphate acyltransferase [Clostridium sp. AM58-1XD]